MQWPEFAHAVRAAGAILGEDQVVVIGSQSILAWFDDPPPETTLSREIDIAALDDPDDRKSHVLAGAIGEGSPFDATFGFHVDGVSLDTPIAPSGWLGRCRDGIYPGHERRHRPVHGAARPVRRQAAGRPREGPCLRPRAPGAGLVDRSTILARLDDTEVADPVREPSPRNSAG